MSKIAADANTKDDPTYVEVISDVYFNDMDWFIGKKSLDKSFDDAQAWLNNVDPVDIDNNSNT